MHFFKQFPSYFFFSTLLLFFEVHSQVCQHGIDEVSQYMTHSVSIKSFKNKKIKRHTSENLKIHLSYDLSLKSLPKTKRNFIKVGIHQKVKSDSVKTYC